MLAERAMPQLVRWESRFGWTRTGARALVGESLTELPGHEELHAFAAEIGAPLPARAQGEAGRFSR